MVVDWDPARTRVVRRDGERLLCGGPAEGLERRVTAWLKREALRVLETETRALAAQAGVTVTRVAIGDPRARWGSCAAHGAIRYSWRLILAPAVVRRSTVAHEVAHRVHMHHGPAFHQLAAALSGVDEAAVRSWFRRHGAGLHWIGRTPDG